MRKPSAKTQWSSTRPETELMLCCARTCMDSENGERIEILLLEDIDWAYLVKTADWQGVMPLVYRNLYTSCADAVPEHVLEQLQKYFHTNVLRNLSLTEELLKLLDLLETHDIPAIPLKGPLLAERLYGNLALRQFGDLDILVQRRDCLRAKDLLISHEYRTEIQLTSAQEKGLLRSPYHCTYAIGRDDGSLSVDFHWALTPTCFSPPLDSERLWERLEPVSLAHTKVLNFYPEDLLLILCTHLSVHCSIGNPLLKWICDVAELIRVHQELDWDQVMEQARSLGCMRMLFLSLFLANRLLGSSLPQQVWKRMQTDTEAQSLATLVREYLFSEAWGWHGPERHVLYLRMRERLRDRARYLLNLPHLGMTLDAKSQALLPLPAVFSFISYKLRLIELLRRNKIMHYLRRGWAWRIFK